MKTPTPKLAHSEAMTARRLVVLASCLLAGAALRGATVPGWSVVAPAFDARLERLSDAQLIDRLRQTDMSCLNGPHNLRPGTGFAYLDGWIELSAPDSSIRIWSPVLRELVRRGVSALPALLKHVTDARPTGLVFAFPHPRNPGSPPTVWLGDVYDSRAPPAPGALGVSTHARRPLPAGLGYAVKVGDLCYVAIGQIVNRRLFIFSYTDAGFDEHGRYRSSGVINGWPFGFAFVDSPVATPALATAVRADWRGLDARSYAEALRADVRSGRDGAGALCRLLAYDPAEGRAEVHVALSRVVGEQGEINFWSINQTVSSLAPFWWPGLGKDLTALFRRAIWQDRRFERFKDTRRNPLATGTAQVLATCAGRLVHRGEDRWLRTVVTEEIKRLRRERRLYGGRVVQVYDYHLGRFEAVLRRLNGEPEAKPAPPEALRPGPAPADLKVTLARPESLPGNWSMFQLHFGVAGISRSQIAAARVRITDARDDTGFDLTPTSVPSFVHPAVGRVGNAVLRRNKPPSLDVYLDAPPGLAKRLVELKGYVELVIPGYDPTSVVRIKQVASAAGAPIRSAALAAAHVSVTVFGARACNAALSGAPAVADGPQSYGARPRFPGGPPAGVPAAMFREPTFTGSDIALGIDDPDGCVVATELVAPDGAALRYNHNGWYHATGAAGRRFDAYRLNRADVQEATLVLDLATGKALVRLPFEFHDVPLPEHLH